MILIDRSSMIDTGVNNLNKRVASVKPDYAAPDESFFRSAILESDWYSGAES